jgi:hypothetical protein
MAACKRQESPTAQSLDEHDAPYLGNAITMIPDDSKLTHPKYSQALAASLRALNIVDPIKDLDAKLGRGDSQFVGIYGYACSAPGLDQSGTGPELTLTADQRLEESHGVVCINGTGDALPPDDRQYMDLYQTAWKYAETYNHELLARIRAGLVK